MACDCRGSLRKIHLFVGRSGNMLGVRLDGSIRCLERDFLYDIVDLIDRLLYGRGLFNSCVHANGKNICTECQKQGAYFMRPAAVSTLVMTAPTSIPRDRA
jgi:hypothetical protein